MDIDQLNCCGVGEIDAISSYTPEEVIENVCRRHMTSSKRAFYVFTEAGSSQREATYGSKLKSYIEKMELGTVSQSSAKKNPNSGNLVKVYVWEVDMDKLDEYILGYNEGFLKQSGLKMGQMVEDNGLNMFDTFAGEAEVIGILPRRGLFQVKLSNGRTWNIQTSKVDKIKIIK